MLEKIDSQGVGREDKDTHFPSWGRSALRRARYGCLWVRPVLVGGLAAEADPTDSGAAGWRAAMRCAKSAPHPALRATFSPLRVEKENGACCGE
jgi:hypothetical protein